MWPTPPHLVLLAGAGLLAGFAGAAGGIASLISFPALLAVGLPPLTANMTNAVAQVTMGPGAALGSRPELAGQGRRLRELALFTATGGGLGAALLLLTPAGVFGRIAPFLVAMASVLLLAQPRLLVWRTRRDRPGARFLLPLGIFAVAVYSGYFGAGSGIMILAVLLILLDEAIPRANALKNVILGGADVVCAAAFALFGPVRFTAALPLAVGLLVGSALGPSVTRRVPGTVIRVLVALAGFGLAIELWVTLG